MNFIRTILSYSLLIILILAVAGAFYYREQLQPHIDTAMNDAQHVWHKYIQPEGDKDTEPDKVVTEQQRTQLVETQSDEQESSGYTQSESVDNAQLSEPAALAENKTPYDSQIPKAQDSNAPDEVMTEAEKEDVTPNVPVEDQGNQAESTVPTVVEDNVVITGLMQANESAATSDSTNVQNNTRAESLDNTMPTKLEQPEALSDEVAILNKARNAFWRGDIKKSISAYNNLIDKNPAEANYYGELGNVLYSSGQWKEAGSSYYQAASILIEQNKPQQVGYLHYVLQGLDNELAEKLAEKMHIQN